MTGVALIDYGAGNLKSVENALRAAGASDIAVTADPKVIEQAHRVVLPGVGAFAHCMGALSAIPGICDAFDEVVFRRGRPFLGICVGMQLLADEGREHGVTDGLAWLSGWVDAIPPAPGIRVPHMGWNDVVPMSDHPVIAQGEAYFLHSYQFHANHPEQIVAATHHGRPVVAAVARDNILGVQFHPEKSQTYGIATLQRFLKWRP